MVFPIIPELSHFAVSSPLEAMNSPLAQLIAPRRMGLYDTLDQFNMWGETLKADKSPDPDPPAIVPADPLLDRKYDYIPHESVENSRSDQEASRPDKIQRRLAQNREAARKSRLRKKAYVQQLESSRLRLTQLELELQRAKQQDVFLSNGMDTNHFAFSRTMNSGIAAFEMEYMHWVEEQQKKISQLRNALQAQVGDMELRILVDDVLKHYHDLFRMKADAAKEDVFYLMSGIWRTSAERFFLWIGGFRPSELLTVLRPHIEPLTDQQLMDVCNLHQSCQQAEDALTQGMDKLQQTLSQEIAADQLGGGHYRSQMAAAMEKLEAVENFVSQADHLRQQTMQRMHCILTTRQAARALLALGEYCHRLRALSSLWAARPREPA